MARRRLSESRLRAKAILEELWQQVLEDEKECGRSDLAALVNSELVAIRFCLPTQLLGKLTNPGLDALCLQSGDGSAGTWDPRTFAIQVVVPWNRDNQAVLGPSGNPYVGNPFRRRRLDIGLEQRRDREQWDKLCLVLGEVQGANDPKVTRSTFIETLRAIRDRLRQFDFTYVVPARVSLGQTLDLVQRFLTAKSGGDRGLALAAAFFETLRDRLGIYSEIRRGVINAADAATKAAGDIECIGHDGSILLAVEVKERSIADADVHLAVAKAREVGVQEVIFCCPGIMRRDEAEIERTFGATWASGTSLYQVSIAGLIANVLPIFGEPAIRQFIVFVGKQLDAFSTQPIHRREWKSLLDAL